MRNIYKGVQRQNYLSCLGYFFMHGFNPICILLIRYLNISNIMGVIESEPLAPCSRGKCLTTPARFKDDINLHTYVTKRAKKVSTSKEG